jgi:hypothetical protein
MATTNRRKAPGGVQRIDYSEAEQLLRQGKTQQEVADHFGVTQGAIAGAIQRGRIKYDKPPRGSRPKEERAVPWSPIRPEHRDKYLYRILRAAHKRELGEKNSPQWEIMLDAFLKQAEEQDFVVGYWPDTEDGFYRIARRPGIDEGLIRNPEYGDDDKLVRRRRGKAA